MTRGRQFLHVTKYNAARAVLRFDPGLREDFAGFLWHAACVLQSVEVSAAYRRREPEKSVLWNLVNENLDTFLAAADARAQDGRSLPFYVRNAFTEYLRCGILQYGFARFLCPGCGHEIVVAFS